MQLSSNRSSPDSVWPVALGAISSILWVYAQFFLSGGTWLAGDTGDTRFTISILDHWLSVLRHGGPVLTLPFFYPELAMLGHSESLILLAPLYGVFRLAGLDRFLAFQFVMFVLTGAGFAAMCGTLRLLSLRPIASTLAALLFVSSSMIRLSFPQGYLLTLAIVPLLILMTARSWRLWNGGRVGRSRLWIAFAGLLLGLQFATCYYIAWFVVFLAIFFAIVLVAVLAVFDRKALRVLARGAAAFRLQMIIGAASFALGLIPFFRIYLPVYLQTGGGRPVDEAYQYLPHLAGFLGVGTRNLLWGALVEKLGGFEPGEMTLGWTPTVAIAACIAGGIALYRIRAAPLERTRLAVIAAAVLTWLASCCLVFKDNGRSLWSTVYRFVPGAAGIRVPHRMDLVSNFLVCLAIGSLLSWMLERRWRTAVVAACGVFFLIEQVNLAPTHLLNRPLESAILARVGPPPRGCGVFFISRAATPDRMNYATQFDAMLEAIRYRLPTVNGDTSVFPADWNLMDIGGDYESQAIARGVSGNPRGVCALDMRTGAWDLVDPRASTSGPHYSIGTTINFRAGGNATLYESRGWSYAEPAGTWTIARIAEVELWLDTSPANDLLLEAEARILSPPQHTCVDGKVSANGVDVASARACGPDRVHIVGRIGRATLADGRRLELRFNAGDPRPAAEYGMVRDPRRLGLLMESLKIVNAELEGPVR